MTISDLNSILVPPDFPNESGSGDVWPSIDKDLSFPSDYIEFISIYGTGRIADFLAIFNPFTQNHDLDFFEQKKLIIEDFKYLNNEYPEFFTYKLYPEINGLLPIGVTDNGDYIFWVVSDLKNSDTWGTAIVASRSPDIECFDENITSLLSGILLRKIKSDSLPNNFPPENITFEKF
ncbi:SMI1/KNR4 family protein [Pectobacterium polaris]|uniref:SMI1/KNR4 family protein n=1 Tax=Pectobacterium polaris TaxID=2042057 RepID=A0AAW4P4S7_9GAMM|nr:SMI1/KNR4 family protein [Pectobacterium polaris]MBW5894509.1 SMI1/KNR4 family protein [Pectobacterium polaris]